MSAIDRAGTFRGHMVSQAIGLSKGGHIQLEVDLVATEYYDQESQQWLDWSKYEETQLHGYLYLVSKDNEPYKSAEQLKKALGWSGETFDELDETDYSGTVIQFRVKMEAYNNKMQAKLDWVDHADATPGSSVKKLDKAEIKALDAKFSKALKALSGGAKAKAVPAGKPSAPKAAAKADPTPPESNGTTSPATTPTTEPAKGKRGRPAAAPKAVPAPAPTSGPAPFDLDKEPVNGALPSACANADEAWEQVEANVDKSVPPAQIEETWLKAVEDMGGPEAIEAESNWAGVRDIVLEILKA